MHLSAENIKSNTGEIDLLELYEHQAIGNEFERSYQPVTREKYREIRQQCYASNMKNWVEASQGDSQRLPKTSLTRTCSFETKRVYSQAITTWMVFLTLTGMAGVFCGIILFNIKW